MDNTGLNKFQILLSCMHEENYDIVKKSNIHCNCLVINQCDKSNKVENNNVTWINSTDRGLSKSRNLAIANSNADICLISDNDEVFVNDVDKIIIKTYEAVQDADIIIFEISNRISKLKKSIYKPRRLELLRVSSWQITFKRKSILNNNLKFDEKLGAGTGNGAGEENKFLLDAYDKGLKIYYCPVFIAEMIDNNESTWFSEYDEEYFYKRGISTRYILGFWISVLYAIYFLIFKYNEYNKNISFFSALRKIFCGIFDNKFVGDKRE